jgi:hypothetical protein
MKVKQMLLPFTLALTVAAAPSAALSQELGECWVCEEKWYPTCGYWLPSCTWRGEEHNWCMQQGDCELNSCTVGHNPEWPPCEGIPPMMRPDGTAWFPASVGNTSVFLQDLVDLHAAVGGQRQVLRRACDHAIFRRTYTAETVERLRSISAKIVL